MGGDENTAFGASTSSISVVSILHFKLLIESSTETSYALVDHRKVAGSFVLRYRYDTAEKMFQMPDITSHAFTKAKSVASIP